METSYRRFARALTLAGWAIAGLTAQDVDEGHEEDRRMEVVHRQSATINGTVRLDSGAPPPEPIPVEVHCESRAVNQVYTDRKGRFSVALGEDSTVSTMDASASGQGSVPSGFHSWFEKGRPSGRCQVRIFLAGFRPEIFDLTDDGGMATIDTGAVVLSRLQGTLGAAVSVTSYEAPKASRKLFESAFRDAHKKKPNLTGAIERLQSAVEMYPRYAAAWDLLGDCALLQGSLADARRAYESALAADGSYLPPYAPLIRIAVQEERWEDVANLTGARMRLARNVESAYYRALALVQLGAIQPAEEALAFARQGPDAARFPQIALVQADIHAALGRYTQAAEQYQAFLSEAPESPARPEIEAIVDGWKRAGKLSSD